MNRSHLLIDGAWVEGACGTRSVLDKYSGTELGVVDQPSREQVAAAVTGARRSFDHAPLDPQQRYMMLMKTASLVERDSDALARLITAEGGMPIADATTEVRRTVQTLIVSAEEAKRLTGEMGRSKRRLGTPTGWRLRYAYRAV
jgi:acyl-CoA reductase-like NAD-dependent aldehyde dehydrogenase